MFKGQQTSAVFFPLTGHLTSHGSLLMFLGLFIGICIVHDDIWCSVCFSVSPPGEEAAPFADGSSFCADLKTTKMDFTGCQNPRLQRC